MISDIYPCMSLHDLALERQYHRKILKNSEEYKKYRLLREEFRQYIFSSDMDEDSCSLILDKSHKKICDLYCQYIKEPKVQCYIGDCDFVKLASKLNAEYIKVSLNKDYAKAYTYKMQMKLVLMIDNMENNNREIKAIVDDDKVTPDTVLMVTRLLEEVDGK